MAFDLNRMCRDPTDICINDAANTGLIYGVICDHVYYKDRIHLVQESVINFITSQRVLVS